MSRRSFDAACAAEVAPVRAGPDESAEQVTQALLGEPLAVLERRDGWARVRTAYEYEGWIREDALRGDALAEARRYLGAPYEWGGMTERGIDCSGLVHVAFRRAGAVVPRDASEQEEAGVSVVEPDLVAGDLVTYGEGERATHIAFWLGDGRILHATGRDGISAVVEEVEPEDLRALRRRFIRFRSQ
jgi:gamma-D-glutamyl-L-lysine dipeptidyl-peptidase